MTKEKDQDQDQSQSQSQSQSTATADSNSNHQSQSQSQAESTATNHSKPPTKDPTCFDELKVSEGHYRPAAQAVGDWLDNISMDSLNHLNEQAENIFYRKGVTFTVYSDAENIERMIPFDIIPRIIAASEWKQIEAGCKQRITALNAFLHDIYHDQAIMKAGVVPASYVYASGCYEPWMMGIQLDKPIYSHISGIDLIRDENGRFCVLEDNLRTPSGVSYMLESRTISETLLSDLFTNTSVLGVSDYPKRLKKCLASSTSKYDPQIVILTPGRFNSAYYEHAFLAHEMNVPLVHGYDLIVENSKVYMQAIRGKAPDKKVSTPDALISVIQAERAEAVRQRDEARRIAEELKTINTELRDKMRGLSDDVQYLKSQLRLITELNRRLALSLDSQRQ